MRSTINKKAPPAPLIDLSSGNWLVGSLAPLNQKKKTGEITPTEFTLKYDLAMSTVPSRRPTGPTNPLTLKDFGYFYNDQGELRTIKDPSSGFIWLGQKHYDYLGEVIVEHIYGVLEGSEFGLERKMVPFRKVRSHSPKRPREEEEADGDNDVADGGTIEKVTDTLLEEAQQLPPSSSSAEVYSQEQQQQQSAAVVAKEKVEDELSVEVPIFASKDLDKYESVMLLSQGSGAVRPGMWARALCVNNSLEYGTIFTYLREAKSRNWGIIVTNPNENTGFPGVKNVHSNMTLWGDNANKVQCKSIEDCVGDIVTPAAAYWLGTRDTDWKTYSSYIMRKAAISVPHNDSPPNHTVHVYKNLILPSIATNVFIVAHSYGGVCTGGLFHDPSTFSDLVKRCPAVAFTDAINTVTRKDSKEMQRFNKERVINWVASKKPLDTRIGVDQRGGNLELSAGHDTHEWTSACCCSSVFGYFDTAVAQQSRSTTH